MKISILTPSYNSDKYIERAIKSVLDQNYPKWEHIIVDGGSTDNTVELLEKYDHLKWISESDKGQSDAMNKAFKLSTGDIIVYLNADDEFTENAFFEIIKYFKTYNDADMVVGNLIKKDEQGNEMIKYGTDSFGKVLNYQWYIFPLNPVSYFYKRHVQLKIGSFPINNKYTMDYWFLLRAFYKFKIYKIDKVLGIFNFDGENKSSDMIRANKQLRLEQLKFLWYPPKPKLIYWWIKNF